jgi:hypothetical protein
LIGRPGHVGSKPLKKHESVPANAVYLAASSDAPTGLAHRAVANNAVITALLHVGRSIYEALTIFGKDCGTLAKSIGASLTRLKPALI